MTCHPLRLSFKFTPGFVLRLRLASTTRDSDGLETHLRYQFGPSFALLLRLCPSRPPSCFPPLLGSVTGRKKLCRLFGPLAGSLPLENSFVVDGIVNMEARGTLSN